MKEEQKKEVLMKNRIVRSSIVFVMMLAAVSGVLFAQLPQKLPQRRDIPRRELNIGIPDMVASLRTTGAPAVVNGSVELPVTVQVRNQGYGQFGKFKVSVEF